MDLIDEDGTHLNAGVLPILVNNVSPTVHLSGAGSVAEGSPYTLSIGSVVDPGDDLVSAYVIHWGDGSPEVIITSEELFAQNGQIVHTFTNGPMTANIDVDLIDEDGTHFLAGRHVVSVTTAARIITLSGQSEADEGSVFLLTIHDSQNPGGELGIQYVVYWGDGSSDTYLTPGSVTHIYPDGPLAATIRVDVIDTGVLQVNAAQHSLSIRNVSPTVGNPQNSASSPGETSIGQLASASFSDPGFDGLTSVEDFMSSTISWGDGIVETIPRISVLEASAGPGLATVGTISGSHTYAKGGIYTVTITARDDDGGSASVSTVVYVTGVRLENGVLQIVGTSGKDDVQIKSKQGNIEVQTDFTNPKKIRFKDRDVNAIHIVLGDGNDHMVIHSDIVKPTVIEAGSGRDHI